MAVLCFLVTPALPLWSAHLVLIDTSEACSSAFFQFNLNQFWIEYWDNGLSSAAPSSHFSLFSSAQPFFLWPAGPCSVHPSTNLQHLLFYVTTINVVIHSQLGCSESVLNKSNFYLWSHWCTDKMLEIFEAVDGRKKIILKFIKTSPSIRSLFGWATPLTPPCISHQRYQSLKTSCSSSLALSIHLFSHFGCHGNEWLTLT